MDPVATIRRLYFKTTASTVQRDLQRAIELFKAMSTDEERARVAVYMDGLSQMRSEWAREARSTRRKGAGGSARTAPAKKKTRR